MISWRRLGFGVLCVVLLVGQTGCWTQRNVAVEQEPPDPGVDAKLHSENGLPIQGYTTAAGAYVEFVGLARLVGDSLEVFQKGQRETGLMKESQGVRYAVPRDSVSQLAVNFANPVGIVFVSLVGVALVLSALAAIAIATKESCPFIYSWDGEQFVFDGEPYGGATMRGLERTDWSELEHLVERDGSYRLLLTNEVDETQHTNRLELLVVDHPLGTRTVMDPAGRPHAFAHVQPLREAHDGNNTDLTHWLRDDDRVIWNPNLDRWVEQDSLTETRDHITLMFDRPTGVSDAFLITRVATGQWGSHMIRSMLGLRGDQVGAFYAAIDSSTLYREQLMAWNRREELFELGVEIQDRDGWRPAAMAPGGGPFVLEARAIRLDLSGVDGETITLRVHPPVGFWSLNSFHLGWGDQPLEPKRIAAHSAVTGAGADVRELLRADDDRYLDFPTTVDRAELVFDAPALVPGQVRTVFAETRGWYQIHLHRAGPPDLAAIDRLTSEPGWAVREAMREYREFRRTGVLRGVVGSAGGR